MEVEKLNEEQETLSDELSEKVEEAKDGKRGYNLTKTAMLVCVYISMGMFEQITGSSVLELLSRVNSNYEGMSVALSVSSIAKVVGALSGGLIYDRLSRHDDILIAIGLIVATIGVVIKPWSGTIMVLALSFAIQGVAQGSLNTMGNAIMVKTWRRKASQPLLIMHTGYPVGMFIAPLIVRPFLGSSKQTTTNSTATGDVVMNSSAVTNSTSKSINYEYEAYETTPAANSTFPTDDLNVASRIEIPYLIVSGILVLSAVAFVILYFCRPETIRVTKRQTVKVKDMFNPRSCADGNMLYGSSMCALLVLFAISFKLSTEPVQYYLFTFAVTGDLKIPKQNAALLDSMQGVGQAIGRLLSAGLKRFLPIKVILISSVYGTLAVAIAMTFLSLRGEAYLWVCVLMFSALCGPIWPATMAWIDRYLVVSGIVVALADVGAALGGFLSQWIVGVLLDNHAAISIMHLTWCASAIGCILVALMQILGSNQGDRYAKSKSYEISTIVVSDENSREKAEVTSKLSTDVNGHAPLLS